MIMVSSSTSTPVSRWMARAVASEPLVSMKMTGRRYSPMSSTTARISWALASLPSSSSMARRMWKS